MKRLTHIDADGWFVCGENGEIIRGEHVDVLAEYEEKEDRRNTKEAKFYIAIMGAIGIMTATTMGIGIFTLIRLLFDTISNTF